uniref:Nuclear-export cofactor Arc1-like N-terminal domain-containing protein n=1 Tax=Felis catus TaxID=9685 RepID=A0ABI7ZBX0_FELCA
MGFGDLKTPAGLQVLNDYLADKSYIEGYVPSQADVAVFEAVSGPPPADLYHALRWYNHIKSYEKEKARTGRTWTTAVQLFPTLPRQCAWTLTWGAHLWGERVAHSFSTWPFF